MVITEKLLGHYELVHEAGRGGTSTVYEAVDTRIGRRVAVKVVTVPPYLTPPQQNDLIARLKREARAIARLSHPNIVTIYDVGEQDGHHFLVMEYLDGITLRERLDRGPLSPDEAVRVLDQVANGLDAVHAEGVVHRDIKPSNVMLLPDGRVKLMDFGVARQADDTMVTQAGMMVGSPAYMAPEQVVGEAGTPASDRWALGVLLYEMLAGRPPFNGGSIPQVLYQVAHDKPLPLPHASSRVQQVLDRALEKNPARRYGSAREMADAFRAAIGAQLPMPHRPREARVSTTPRRRARPLLWLLPLVLLAAVGGGIFLARSAGPDLRAARNAPTEAKPHRAVAATPEATAPRAVAPPVRVRVAAARQERAGGQRIVRLPLRRHALRRPRAKALRLAAAPTIMERQTETTSPKRRTRRPLPPVAPRAQERTRIAARPVPASPAAGQAGSGPNLLGTWHGWQGIHGHDPATLTVLRRRGDSFDGVMTVRTPEHAVVRVALTGRVSPGGRVTMRETRILSSTKPHAWDLGRKSGQLSGDGMSGVDHDIRGRTAHWSFSR